MGSFSIWHWLVVIIWLLPMIPIATILKKAGFGPWWTLLYLVPIGNLIGLFVFANAKWPARA
jgi:hypothetical protein